MSLLKVLSILSVFSKNQLLDLWILWIVLLVSMSFNSALILVISFLLLAVVCLCCCSSSSCRCINPSLFDGFKKTLLNSLPLYCKLSIWFSIFWGKIYMQLNVQILSVKCCKLYHFIRFHKTKLFFLFYKTKLQVSHRISINYLRTPVVPLPPRTLPTHTGEWKK